MSLETDIQSMYKHTKDIYDSLELLGSTLPESKNLESLANTFGNIPLQPTYYTVTFDANGGTPAPAPQQVVSGETATQPANPSKTSYNFQNWTLNGQPYDFNTPVTSDITLVASYVQDYDPSNPTLSNIKKAVNAGDYTSYPIGSSIPDTVGGVSNPLIVTQYLDNNNNSDYGGAVGVILTRQYLGDAQAYGSSSDYSSSSILNWLNSTYYNSCSDELKSMISEFSVKYQSNASASGKFHLPGANEIGVRDTNGIGIFFDLWKQRTGLSTASGSANGGRIMRKTDGSASAWWTRTPTTGGIDYIGTSGELIISAPSNARRTLTMCFIAKD